MVIARSGLPLSAAGFLTIPKPEQSEPNLDRWQIWTGTFSSSSFLPGSKNELECVKHSPFGALAFQESLRKSGIFFEFVIAQSRLPGHPTDGEEETRTVSAEFRIGEWLVDPAVGSVAGKDATVHLEPRVMEVLVYLARHPGEVIPKERLLARVESVEESAVHFTGRKQPEVTLVISHQFSHREGETFFSARAPEV